MFFNQLIVNSIILTTYRRTYITYLFSTLKKKPKKTQCYGSVILQSGFKLQPTALKNLQAFRLEAGTLEIVRNRGAKIAKNTGNKRG